MKKKKKVIFSAYNAKYHHSATSLRFFILKYRTFEFFLKLKKARTRKLIKGLFVTLHASILYKEHQL